jgi:hypothetical protein
VSTLDGLPCCTSNRAGLMNGAMLMSLVLTKIKSARLPVFNAPQRSLLLYPVTLATK